MNEFNHLHPGGAKIIQSYAGMDGTIAYQKVDHHVNSEVDAMLGMYELGVLRTPDFGQVWGVALSAKGLRFVALRDLFDAWVHTLYMLVEIENAVLNDYRIRQEPFTDIETAGTLFLTPSKAQQLVLAHERLLTGYLDHLLGEPINELWTLTTGVFERQTEDIRWLSRRLAEIRAGEPFQTAVELAARFRERLKADEGRLTMTPTEWQADYAPFCQALEEADRRLLHDLKLALREGIVLFETYEQETGTQADALLAILRRIPEIVADYCAAAIYGYPHFHNSATILSKIDNLDKKGGEQWR